MEESNELELKWVQTDFRNNEDLSLKIVERNSPGLQ